MIGSDGKNTKAGFDDRIVDFSVIHNHKKEDVTAFVDIIDAKKGQVILDGMDGYGSVAKEILKKTEAEGFHLEIYTVDESSVQVERARQNIPHAEEQHIIQADIRKVPFEDNKFDTVVIKMGIHEVPKGEQIKVVQEMYRVLKPGGKFVTWELSFLDPETQKAFQDIIRKKDEIAGFEKLVTNRYFPRRDELLELFTEAGFQNVAVAHRIDSQLTMRVRETELVSKDKKKLLDEKGSLRSEDEDSLKTLGTKRCDELVSFIKKYMADAPDELKKKFDYYELENDVHLVPNKEIIVGFKPVA